MRHLNGSCDVPLSPGSIRTDGARQSLQKERGEKQDLSGSVPGKESLKQEIQWSKTSAAQRTVLLLWHTGDTVSNVPFTAQAREYWIHCVSFVLLEGCALLLYFFFYVCSTHGASGEVPVKDVVHLWASDTAAYKCPVNAGD